jgi:uncharacterized protein YbaR (Trm112 family)
LADIDMNRCLVCPLTGCRLKLSEDRRWLVSKAARLRYPIIDGVPVLKVDKAQQMEEK